jgi:zinc protease
MLQLSVKNFMLFSIVIVGGLQAKAKNTAKTAMTNKVPGFKVPTDKIRQVVLENGMKIVAYKDSRIPKVRLQIAYDVGSSVENESEKGLAHLVEHMIFKGTRDKDGNISLAERDVSAIGKKYGAIFNAFTTNDTTTYFFETDKNNWQPLVGVLADCMENVRFDEQHLASELKVVVEELSSRRNNDGIFSYEKGSELLFPKGHPYHHSIIGYVDELINFTSEDVKRFYEKYYCPQKAVLFIAGDIDFNEAFSLAKKNFAKVLPGLKCASVSPFKEGAISQVAVFEMYRNIIGEGHDFFWKIPGLKSEESLIAAVFSDIFAGKIDSRLIDRLISTEKIANNVISSANCLHQSGMFLLSIVPKVGFEKRCEEILFEELEKVFVQGVTEKELQKSVNSRMIQLFELIETPTNLVPLWLNDYLATGDLYSIFHQAQKLSAITKESVQAFCKKYLSRSGLKKVVTLPIGSNVFKLGALAAEQNLFANQLQVVLKKHQRTSELEPLKKVHSLPAAQKLNHEFLKPTHPKALVKGATVVYGYDAIDPVVSVAFSLKDVDSFILSKDGVLVAFMMGLLLEQSEGFSKQENHDFFGQLGTNYSFGLCSKFSGLNVDLSETLQRFVHVLKSPKFSQEALERSKEQNVLAISQQKNDGVQVGSRALFRAFYQGSCFDWDHDQIIEEIKNVTIGDLEKMHQQYLHPENIIIGVVGNFDYGFFNKELSKAFSGWLSPLVKKQEFPAPVVPKNLEEKIDMSLAQSCLFISLPLDMNVFHPDNVALDLVTEVLFASLGSRLFRLRDRTGLFYFASGKIPCFRNKQGSISSIFALLNPERREEGEGAIGQMLAEVVQQGITIDELEAAKKSYCNSLLRLTGSKSLNLLYLVGLENSGFEEDHYDNLWQKAQSLTLEEVNAVIKKHYKLDQMFCIKVKKFSFFEKIKKMPSLLFQRVRKIFG